MRKSKNAINPRNVISDVKADFVNDYDSLAKDVIGDDGSESDEDREEKGKGRNRRSHDEDKEKDPEYMLFDFRKSLLWPTNVELIDMRTYEKLLEKATAAAEEAAKLKKKDNEDDDSKKRESGTATVSIDTSVAWEDTNADEEENEDSGYSQAEFETLKDGSNALIIKPGFRLKLRLKDLLDGGDAMKEKRERKAEKQRQQQSSLKADGDGWMMPYDFWSSSSMGGSKWFKEYINEYTITMDIKLLDDPPRDGIALFQTALIHSKEDKRSGKTTLTKSDGECLINQAGGIGNFGTFGDTTKAKLEKGIWKRIVISVKCTDSKNTKGEMRTWVGTEPGVILKEDSLTVNERFAIDPTSLYIFSSTQSAMMPGNIAVRTIRVERKFADDRYVKENRARDKLLSLFNEDRKKEIEEQRKGLSLAALFAKPRPMWIAPAFVGVFGDAFIEKSTLEGSSNLSWSFTVLNLAIQKMSRQNMLCHDSYGLDYNTRVVLSDTQNILQQSEAVFKIMLRMLKTPTDSQLLSFLRKLKKYLLAVGVGESLLLPALVEGVELCILLERSSERFFRVIVINTNAKAGLRHHSVSGGECPPEIRYRTCLVLNSVSKKNALDDVFWMALYNMAIRQHEGDTDRFYDILLPFLTGKPLESTLVEAEKAAVGAAGGQVAEMANSRGTYGYWRRPQRSETAYVRCIMEAVHYLLVRRGATELQTEQIHLGLCMELVCMLQNDLKCMLPDKNGVRVASLAIKELSHLAVCFIDHKKREVLAVEGGGSVAALDSGVEEKKEGLDSTTPTISMILEDVHHLVQSVTETLSYCSSSETDVPPALELSPHGAVGVENVTASYENDLSLYQFQSVLAWDSFQSDPDPGQAVALRKYIPIDILQIPKRARTRQEAVAAIRQCDRLSSLIENQNHCIKNSKFLILAMIEHVFTQVIPLPKPRGLNLSEEELQISEKSIRRAEAKKVEEASRLAEKKRKIEEKRNKESLEGAGGALSKFKSRKDKDKEAKESAEVAESKLSLAATLKCFGGEEIPPDFTVGKEVEARLNETHCIWDEPIHYELQVELMITLQRLSEHFAAAAFSIQQSRSFDGVCIVVPGCVAAIADAIMRKLAVDHPSEVCGHLMGRTLLGRQLGHPGYGISVGTFATQSETIEIHSPELSIARTAVLDYFQSPQQKRLDKMFSWEEDYLLKPGKNLIKYLRNVAREIGLGMSKPHNMMVDNCPVSSELMKNYPELHCYRDIVFFWKYFLNTDRKVFPNYINFEDPHDLTELDRMAAQLKFEWDDNMGEYAVHAFDRPLKCRPDPKQKNPITGKIIPLEHLPTHRFPSTATPSFYVPLPAVRTEDDVIYRPNLPSFDDKYGHVLNQRDSELLISYLTVPYIRLPLLLSFFSSEDRIHKLQSADLRQILDSVLFEPGKYLRVDMTSVEPVMVPTPHPELLATSYGLLLNELCRSPDTAIRSVLVLLRGALACDTGSVVDEGATEFNTSTTIIMYMIRVAARVDNYLSFLIDVTTGHHDCLVGPFRETVVTAETLKTLKAGLAEIRELLHSQFNPLFEDYLKRLDTEVNKNPSDEKLIDRNSRLACDLQSHKLLMYRNYHEDEYDPVIAKTLVGSFIYLTTRHTWNKTVTEGARLQMPETELYELLQVQRRRLINWITTCCQGKLDEVMQSALQISSSLTGSMKVSAEVLDSQNRWSRIMGDRSVGRWAVGSTRSSSLTTGGGGNSNNSNKNSSGTPTPRRMLRQISYNKAVGEVADTGMLGVEIDMQTGQMTLRSRHLSALGTNIANHPDVMMIFGDATIQASLLERAEHRQRLRLVGLNHELEYWPNAHTVCPPLGDEWGREYDPADLFESERWITSIFEPVRKSFFDGPRPPPMQFMMPEKPLPANAEVAVILGLHQVLGGPWKLVYLFRRLRCLHIYECVSQGREWWFSLHLTTDYRYSLHELEPVKDNREVQYPDWWIRGGGAPYPQGLQVHLMNDLFGASSSPHSSVLIIRDVQHHLNMSGGKETLVPARLLYGLVPDVLLETYYFWQDEREAPAGTRHEDMRAACRGYKHLRGYPKEEEGEYMLFVEIQYTGSLEDYNKNASFSSVNNENVIQCTGLPGRTVRVTRRPKPLVDSEFHRKQRLASLLESLHLLVPPEKKKQIKSDVETEGVNSEHLFKMDAAVECDYEGKGEYWPCIIRRIHDNGTYDVEYVNDYKWVGIQRGVEPELVQTRGSEELRKRGEGLWHWEGMSDSEDDDWREDNNGGPETEDGDENDPESKLQSKGRITFEQFELLGCLLDVTDGNEDVLTTTLHRLASVPGVLPFQDIVKLSKAVSENIAAATAKQEGKAESQGSSRKIDEEDMVLLNLMYAPRRNRMFSVMKVLSRIENTSHICAWTRASSLKPIHKSENPLSLSFDCPSIDLVELPRLKLSFVARPDHNGTLRLFSTDHMDLYITNDSNPITPKMLAGIPHSLLLSNVRGETQVLVPVITPFRPRISNEPFSTFIVLHRSSLPLAERYFMYPIHISFSFLLTKGLNSAVYLMLLRFLHRDYADVFRLADSIATDKALNEEGTDVFAAFSQAKDDWHPDAHACRLKISLVTMDSGMELPWDLTTECARHSVKLDSVSCDCRLSLVEELQLLESDFIVTSPADKKYDAKIHDEYTMTLCYNRQQLLRTLTSSAVHSSQKSVEVVCRTPPRALSSNWPYYQDNTIFGENYMQMLEVTSEEEGEHSWKYEVLGGDETDAPAGGWLVVACFHTLWSAACLKVVPAVTELVPLYQDLLTFLSVRADCQGMTAVSKSQNITVFPTFVIYRGGREVERLAGRDRAVEKLVRSLATHLKPEDKVARAKYRHRLRVQAALELGLPPPTEGSEEEKEVRGGQLDWTWDPEQCGSSLRIEEEGVRAVLRSEDDEEEPVYWEYSSNRMKWTAFKNETVAAFEKVYRSGALYDEEYFDCAECDLYLDGIEIGSYEITGFSGRLSSTRRSVAIRRRGPRFVVHNEGGYVTKEQLERDRKNAEWTAKFEAYRKKMKEQMIGNDTETIKGTIGLLPNTGVHHWTLRWGHEPNRQGSGDCIGVCTDACETFGPAPSPLLGGVTDAGASLALYASGEIYHNGRCIAAVVGERAATPVITTSTTATSASLSSGTTAVPTSTAALYEVGNLVVVSSKVGCADGDKSGVISKIYEGQLSVDVDYSNGNKGIDISIDSIKLSNAGQQATAVASEEKKAEEPGADETKLELPKKPMMAAQLAPLFGEGSLVRCELDSGVDGGTLTFFVDGRQVGPIFKDAYALLGGSELFPAVCMCPLDPTFVEEVKKWTVATAVVEAKLKAEQKTAEDPAKKEKKKKSKDKDKDESDGQDVYCIYPNVTLLPYENEPESGRVPKQSPQKTPQTDSELPTKGDLMEEPEAVAAAEEKKVEEKGSDAEGVPNENPGETETKNEEVKEEGEADGDAKKSKEEDKEVEVEVPIEKVRWMYDTPEGWCVYSAEISRDVEAAVRENKAEFIVTLGDDTHKCNLETKKQTRDESTNQFKMRRHILSDGLAGLWEILSLKFERPYGTSGQGLLKILEKVWSNNEKMDGKHSGLGFLFLYTLFSGDVRCKVGVEEWGSDKYSRGGGGGMSGPYQFNRNKGTSSNDSHRFGLLLSQLYTDRHSKSLLSSVINVLGRNRQVTLRMPKFKDTRKVATTSVFNGWTDESEPRSPLAELFARLVPVMASMKRKGAFHFPPPPPYAELPPPQPLAQIEPLHFKEWDRPELSDYGCEQRTFLPLSAATLAELAMRVGYRLGADELHPEPPLHVEDMDHYNLIMKQNSDRLVILDFHATWCAPCRSLTPVFQLLSLRTPTAKFLKIDIDELDDLAEKFKIKSVPTIIFLRGGSTPANIVGKIGGGGSEFFSEFSKILLENSTENELAALERFHSNAPGENVVEVLQNLATTPEEVGVLASRPLAACKSFIVQLQRQELGLKAVNPEIAFDVSQHDAAKTAPAVSVLQRFKDDVAAYAQFANTSLVSRIANISDKTIDLFFSGNADAQGELEQGLRHIKELKSKLMSVKLSDSAMLQDAIPLLEKAANFLAIDQEDSVDVKTEKTRFLLSRCSGQNTSIWVEFLFGSLLSSQGEQDLLKLNPYLSDATIATILQLVMATMLRANRLGLTNRCIGTVIAMEGLLDKVLCLSLDSREEKRSALTPKLIQIGDDLSSTLSMARHYMTPSSSTTTTAATSANSISNGIGYSFDPRYLVFEFVWNIQLRKKQVEIVNDFRNCLANDRSKVKQMIMGAGKTSVVAPLLALIVADGKSLVLSVVPKALVEMSRTRMRETFAAIMVKRIYTLEFDRSTVVKPAIRRSLENAAANRGVVVATPTTLKSIMLSYIESLQQIQEAKAAGLKTKMEVLRLQSEELSKILSLFKEGIMLLDEVDLILHPLKSELNFPIGDKYDLDGSDEGERWNFPIHLLDAIFFTQSGRVSAFESGGSAMDILKKIAIVLHQGVQDRHLQRLPHITLLNLSYYDEHIKPLMAEWAYLWLQKQHLHGIDRAEAVRYMLEGAAARTDTTAKLNHIDLAITKTLVTIGELPADPRPTRGYERSMSLAEREGKSHSVEEELRSVSTAIHANASLEELLRCQLRQLEHAKSTTIHHKQLVSEIYEIDEKIEALSKSGGHRLGEIQGAILALHKKIGDIECPRDDSLDNCVVVWCSQAFSAVNVGSGVSSATATTPGESSVPSVCNTLEDLGLTIRRCSDPEEAVSRARDLQLEGQLRCVVMGGDERGLSCGPSCVMIHDGDCIRCNEKFSRHNGHDCRFGGRGSWLLQDKAAASKVSSLEMMKTLTDSESPYARVHRSLPAGRTAVYSAHTAVKEDERMVFWKLGTTVTDDHKQLVTWVMSLPPWSPVLEDVDGEEGGDAEVTGSATGDGLSLPLVPLKRESSTATEKVILQQYRVELEQLEMQKATLSSEEDSQRKMLQQQAAEKNASLEQSVAQRIGELTVVFDDIHKVLTAFGISPNETESVVTRPQNGRDAAVALAWFEVNHSSLKAKAAGSPIPSSASPLLDEPTESELLKCARQINNELSFLRQMALAAKVVAHVTSPMHKKLLNLCHNWLDTFLPHCLAKVNRVSFGLLTVEDCKAALELDPHVPRSRLKLGVPFVGKDVPSKSSEFAHPDIIIGLTILAYRYSGLRRDDFVDIVDSLTSQFTLEIGPARDRDSSIRHESWVFAAGGSVRGLKLTRDNLPWDIPEFDDNVADREVVQLKFLQKSNEEQMEKLFNLLRFEPLVIHHYLQKSIFPLHMRSQKNKISASGQAVGGDMLVRRRVGFSGTPSDLLPQELGRCDYETGDDGMMLSTVLDRAVASYELLADRWTVEQLIDRIAAAESPRVHALIDTGALVTGYSNLEVARQLLDRGLTWCDGVVFLDDQDRQQVLVRATGRVVSADQCGVSLEKRFAFYDQIHTTGMDIKHVVNATAVITLGKDMVFRDYVQGAYRMRGIGAGQKIHVFIIPEVKEIMARELKDAKITCAENATTHVLEDVVAWLIINSLRSEQTQWTMLCLQNISNLYRKNAFKCLHQSVDLFLADTAGSPTTTTSTTPVVSSVESESSAEVSDDSTIGNTTPARATVEPPPSTDFIAQLSQESALAVFEESIDFSLESGVPDPLPFEDKLRSLLEDNESFLQPHQHTIGHSIMVVVGHFAMLESSANRLDTEQEREQEQEQEKEVEARRDQQIEVEKFVDREYSRQEEFQRPWPFSMLSKSISQVADHPFYALKDFKLRHQEPLQFHDSLLVSSNFFNPNWTGLRRVKNVIMVVEYAPSTDEADFRLMSSEECLQSVTLTALQEQTLRKAHTLLGFRSAASGNPHYLSREDLTHAIFAVTDEKPSEDLLTSIMESFSAQKSMLSYEEFRSLLLSGVLNPMYNGRYWVAVSLAEAETMRRILHIRKEKHPEQIIANSSTELALRYSPMSAPHAASGGDGGVVFDASWGWQRGGSGATHYESAVAHSSFRFFDCDMHYSNAALNVLVKVLKGSVNDRERFFQSTIGCRRRLERKWQETPLAKVFLVADEWAALKQRAQAIYLSEALKARQLTLWEAFTAFDYDNNGVLSPAEFYGALVWLGVPELTVEDVADFIETADKNRDGMIDYKEYMDMLTLESQLAEVAEPITATAAATEDNENEFALQIDTSHPNDRLEEEEEVVDADRAPIPKVEPYGAEELREVMVHRKQLEQAKLREERQRRQSYKDALDVKVFEEEISASRNRKGGANPAVYPMAVTHCITNQEGRNVDGNVKVTDFKFSLNQHPLRFTATGKSHFLPILQGTAADRPVKLMTCPRGHSLNSYFHYWMNCVLCGERGTHYYCSQYQSGAYCGSYICSGCYDSDRREKEIDRRDPSKHETCLRCSNACSFTLQIPVAGGACSTTGRYTLSMALRLAKLPPVGHLQSLLRFSLPDLAQTRRLHRTSVYINGDGRVVAKPLITGGEVDSDSSKVKAGVWQIVSIAVDPSAGVLCSYINGKLCHRSCDLDPIDLRLHHRLVVLGGGKQAHAKGGDIHRLVIHSACLDETTGIFEVYQLLANGNPGIGGRVLRIQSLYRGYVIRKLNLLKKDLAEKKKEKEEEEEEDN